jgi:SNF2 family DNA or RNA helicase
MDENIANKLLSFQVAHTLQLQECLQKEVCAIDASDTGTGKTYCTVALCKLLNLSPLIICPKSVINTWNEVCGIFGVKLFGIANYEMLKSGKYYTENLELTTCPYFDKIKVNEKTDFIFQLPENVMIIFDEAHRCKNYKTSTSKILLSAHKTQNKIILLSATISDKIECFKPFGVVFGLYNKLSAYNGWMRKQLLMNKVMFDMIDKKKQAELKAQQPKEAVTIEDLRMTDDQKKLYVINKALFPKFGSRMKIKELGNLFPQNNIISRSYYLANHKEVDQLHEQINMAMDELKNKETRSEALGKIIRAKQRIELLKVPIFHDLAQEALDNGYSIAIFVNYRETMDHLCHLLETACVIHGGQTLDERAENIKEFQNNKSNKIIAITQAGGVGISLHDIHGGHPRMSIISPTWSGQDLIQCLGRIHRAGSKSPAIQKLVFCARTYEEQIGKIIQRKLLNLSGINDGDLIGPKIPNEKVDEFNKLVVDESYKYCGRKLD